MEKVNYFLQQLINGISCGSIYAMIAIGYSMVYGLLYLVNFAHGDLYVFGTFIAYSLMISLASKVQIFHPFARCFCACFRGLYKPYWKGFPLKMLKTLLKAWKTRLYGQFSTVSGGVFNILWKTFQHNSTDKHPRSLGKLPVLPPFLRVKLTIITGVCPFFHFPQVFPTPFVDKKRKVHPAC